MNNYGLVELLIRENFATCPTDSFACSRPSGHCHSLDMSAIEFVRVNPLRAKFFRGNLNIYLHFMSFLHTNKTQVVEIPPRVRQGPALPILHNQYHGC